MDCAILKEIDVPPTLRYIASKAFLDCTCLTGLNLMRGEGLMLNTRPLTCATGLSFRSGSTSSRAQDTILTSQPDKELHSSTGTVNELSLPVFF